MRFNCHWLSVQLRAGYARHFFFLFPFDTMHGLICVAHENPEPFRRNRKNAWWYRNGSRKKHKKRNDSGAAGIAFFCRRERHRDGIHQYDVRMTTTEVRLPTPHSNNLKMGPARFELATSSTSTMRYTGLNYGPNDWVCGIRFAVCDYAFLSAHRISHSAYRPQKPPPRFELGTSASLAKSYQGCAPPLCYGGITLLVFTALFKIY